jgi:23S rRNA (cytosine1962-C5)-methyltransferase
MLNIHLKEGRDKPVRNGHPWIFSGAVQRIEGGGASGEPCRVVGASGAILGHGYYNTKSSITVRMLTRGDTQFTAAHLRSRIDRALAARSKSAGLEGPSAQTDSYRLINSEGDFLPGLIVDRYGKGLCVQILTWGMERIREDIIGALCARLAPAFIVERSDTEARLREGLEPREGCIRGSLPGELVIRENGIVIGVDLSHGQKTGYYFDQRENRLLMRDYAAKRRCLDCFSYSGAFGLNALAGGAASVTAVDSSKQAVNGAEKNFARNGYDATRANTVCADIFTYLRESGEGNDLIVLDPPTFARHPSEVAKAARGYKDVNLLAMKKVVGGGIVFTFSCSGAVDSRLFRQIVFAAASDCGRNVQLLHILTAGPDHPVNIAHPEGEYLKGLVVRVE